MKLRGRLDHLERATTPIGNAHTGARELLLERFKRTNPETRKRLLTAISERIEHATAR